jgi:imidazolonepropionase-like amidohydrolase
VWLQVGALLDGAADPLPDAHVVYDAAQILHVGARDRPPPAGVLGREQREPDWRSRTATLLPGLAEAHAHLFLEGGELDAARRAAHLKRPPAELLADAEPRLRRLIDWGVVAVRDAGDRDGVGLALRRRYLQPNRPPLPYLDSPGAAIHHRGRYGSFMGDPLEDQASPRETVAARVAAGADRIKLIPTGIINFQRGAVTTEPQMTVAEIREIAETARSFGRQSFAHASGDAGIDRAIEGGVDSIEHGYFIREDQLVRLAATGIAWVPTFAPVAAQLRHADRMGWDQAVRDNLRRILDGHAASLRRAHQLGVRIVAGSDAGSYGVPHGSGFLWEMQLMEEAGVPPAAVIRSATAAGSDRLAFREKFGRIAPGYRSRFILASRPPLETVAHLRGERIVVFDGEPRELGAETPETGL